MVPDFFIHMKEFPLTANGKVDSDKLPLPVFTLNDTTWEEPEGETEQELSKLISEILLVDRVGRGDSFYSLGGNSLKAAELLYRVYEVFAVRITVKDILKYPVLSRLAGRID